PPPVWMSGRVYALCSCRVLLPWCREPFFDLCHAWSAQPGQPGPTSGEDQQDGTDRSLDRDPHPRGPRAVGGGESDCGEPAARAERKQVGPYPFDGHLGGRHRHGTLAVQGDRDVLAVDEDVDEGFEG